MARVQCTPFAGSDYRQYIERAVLASAWKTQQPRAEEFAGARVPSLARMCDFRTPSRLTEPGSSYARVLGLSTPGTMNDDRGLQQGGAKVLQAPHTPVALLFGVVLLRAGVSAPPLV